MDFIIFNSFKCTKVSPVLGLQFNESVKFQQFDLLWILDACCSATIRTIGLGLQLR